MTHNETETIAEVYLQGTYQDHMDIAVVPYKLYKSVLDAKNKEINRLRRHIASMKPVEVESGTIKFEE
jgi:hypothetical protein